MKAPERHPSSSDGVPDPLATLHQETFPVSTQALQQRGIGSLRILSQSKFADLVRRLIEESLRTHLEEAPARPTPASGTAPEGEEPFKKNWDLLRARHEESLQRIEGRMEKLSRVFQGLEGALERLQGPGSSSTATHPSPQSGAVGPPAGSGRQKSLLREMLLNGDGG